VSWAKWWPAQLSKTWLALGRTTKFTNTASQGMAFNLDRESIRGDGTTTSDKAQQLFDDNSSDVKE